VGIENEVSLMANAVLIACSRCRVTASSILLVMAVVQLRSLIHPILVGYGLDFTRSGEPRLFIARQAKVTVQEELLLLRAPI
jgi:hypothetical protein